MKDIMGRLSSNKGKGEGGEFEKGKKGNERCGEGIRVQGA